ncbi:MAG TPA: transposase [Streptosporangiaceae bacterium]|nr:transposase [Streptosporangiaceae bacterium]
MAAERVQHDLHECRCACARVHVAARPAGMPDSVLSIGPRLRALAVYLVVFQHVPVERCQQLIRDVTGAAVSAGFVHSCLRQAASLAAEVVRLIRALITAAAAGVALTVRRSLPLAAAARSPGTGALITAGTAGRGGWCRLVAAARAITRRGNGESMSSRAQVPARFRERAALGWN